MTKPRAKPATAKPAALKPGPVLTMAAGTIGPYGYTSGLILEDVPGEVAAAHAEWMDADPEKVKAARAAGADAVPYRG